MVPIPIAILAIENDDDRAFMIQAYASPQFSTISRVNLRLFLICSKVILCILSSCSIAVSSLAIFCCSDFSRSSGIASL